MVVIKGEKEDISGVSLNIVRIRPAAFLSVDTGRVPNRVCEDVKKVKFVKLCTVFQFR